MFAERLICSWIGALGMAAGAFCQTYVQFSVDSSTMPTSINEKGEMAGYYFPFGAGGFHGFVRDPSGSITTFLVPGSFQTAAFSINYEGAITGVYNTFSAPGQHGYIRDSEGNITPFDLPGSMNTDAVSINAGGAVTGLYNESNGHMVKKLARGS